ncbi:hypothetical protein EYC80_003153 [Monilinia laxa]|uniref:Uncharacterized protein n=1 Tax=Monilinia laxa TaxID=61186 RepID=A0A5N6KCZ6_MONLA|nr:hypothetical protein EYC80_003153 [Monilinia laxa]
MSKYLFFDETIDDLDSARSSLPIRLTLRWLKEISHLKHVISTLIVAVECTPRPKPIPGSRNGASNYWHVYGLSRYTILGTGH